MRTVFGIILLVVLIVSGGIYTQDYLTFSSNELVKNLYSLDKEIRHEKWAQAKVTQTQLEEDWDKIKPKWAIFLNHHEIDNIDMSLAQSKAYIETTQHGDALSKVSELILLFNHIPEKEKVAIKNIL